MTDASKVRRIWDFIFDADPLVSVTIPIIMVNACLTPHMTLFYTLSLEQHTAKATQAENLVGVVQLLILFQTWVDAQPSSTSLDSATDRIDDAVNNVSQQPRGIAPPRSLKRHSLSIPAYMPSTGQQTSPLGNSDQHPKTTFTGE